MIPLRIFWRATPPAVKWAALGALVLALAYAAGRYSGGQAAALDEARDHIETRERIDDAMGNPDGCAWHDRLRNTCE